MKKNKALIIGLADHYWADFVISLREKLAALNVESVVVMESRLGEYQKFWKRVDLAESDVYYLTDFAINRSADYDSYKVTPELVFANYIRVHSLKGGRGTSTIDWERTSRILAAFADYVLEENPDISVIVHEAVSTSLSMAFYKSATRLGIPYIGFVGSKIPGRYEYFLPFDRSSELIIEQCNKYLEDLLLLDSSRREWAVQYLRNLDQITPDYMKNNKLNDHSYKSVLSGKNFGLFFGTIIYSLFEKKEARLVLTRSKPIAEKMGALFRNLARVYKARRIENIFQADYESFLIDKKYFLYPIHYQPEASTSVGSPLFVNQFEVIKNLSYCLKDDEYLVVKEHVSNIGYPSIDFYESIKSLPNVVLINPSANTKKLIRGSNGVVTLTSTVGFEAVLLGIRTVTFGDVFYNRHALCRKISSYSDALNILRSIRPINNLEDYNVAFLNAYRDYTYPGIVQWGAKGLNISNEVAEQVRALI